MSRPGSAEEKQANQEIIDAKVRILMTEPRGVICALATYWAQYVVAECPQAMVEKLKKDVAIYQAMRSEFFRSLGLATAELDPAVLVPYLRSCVLSKTDLEKACRDP